MEIGHCPTCARPFTASEITGFGILKPRPAEDGGPHLEYACPGCGRRLRLIPHGQGRYALPGQPPPAHVPLEARAPPWMRGEQAQRGSADPARPPRESAPEPDPVELPPLDVDGAEADELPLTHGEARLLLGVDTTASPEAVERAYRSRSLTCHPDKVAHLDADFIALAERKFRRLREAYELLAS